MKKFAILTTAVIVSACASKEQLPPQQANISHVEVTKGKSGKVELEITDEQTISAIVEFINQRPHEWKEAFGGVAEGDTYLTFYRDKRFVGNFYVGDDFYGRDYGLSWIQDSDEASVKQLSQIVGFDMSGGFAITSCPITSDVAVSNMLRLKQVKEKPLSEGQFESYSEQYAYHCDSEISDTSYRMFTKSGAENEFILHIMGNESKYFGPFTLDTM